MDFNKITTCSFFGHRNFTITKELKENLEKKIRELITKNGVDTFLFGSRSRFDSYCHKVVSDIKKEFPNIKRIYVRAEYPDISKTYEDYLLGSFENTIFPDKIRFAGRAIYVERNIEMIKKSNFCIIYYNKLGAHDRSGTKKAYEFALKEKVKIYNLLNNKNEFI